jgi:hypothetical protein
MIRHTQLKNSRIFQVYDMPMLSREDPQNLVPITNDIAVTLQHGLTRLGFYNESITGTMTRRQESR